MPKSQFRSLTTPSLPTSALRARLVIEFWREELTERFTILLTYCGRLAYAEMRLVIARLAWQFEIELVDKETDWMDQEVYWSWKRPALMVRLRERITK